MSLCTPTEALNLLRRYGGFSPRAAAKMLTDAIHDPDVCRLWCDRKKDDPPVPANFVERLKVVAELDQCRWTARIISAVREAWEKPDKPVYDKKTGELVAAPYQWEFDVDEVVALLPVRRGRKGVNWEIYVTLELERLGRKCALDMHNSGQLVPHLKYVLQQQIGRVPKDDKVLTKPISAFLRSP